MVQKRSKHDKLLQRIRKTQKSERDKTARRERAMERVQLRIEKRRATDHCRIGTKLAKANGVDIEKLQVEHAKADQLMSRQLAAQSKRMIAEGKAHAKARRTLYKSKHKTASLMLMSRATASQYELICEAERFETWADIRASGTTRSFSASIAPCENVIKTALTHQGPAFSGTSSVGQKFHFVWVPSWTGIARVCAHINLNGAVQLATPNVCTYFEPTSMAAVAINLRMWSYGLDGTDFSSLQVLPWIARADGGSFATPIQQSYQLQEQYVAFESGRAVVFSVDTEFAFRSWNGGRVSIDFSSGHFDIHIPLITLTFY